MPVRNCARCGHDLGSQRRWTANRICPVCDHRNIRWLPPLVWRSRSDADLSWKRTFGAILAGAIAGGLICAGLILLERSRPDTVSFLAYPIVAAVCGAVAWFVALVRHALQHRAPEIDVWLGFVVAGAMLNLFSVAVLCIAFLIALDRISVRTPQPTPPQSTSAPRAV